jgi:hypothetical protein
LEEIHGKEKSFNRQHFPQKVIHLSYMMSINFLCESNLTSLGLVPVKRRLIALSRWLSETVGTLTTPRVRLEICVWPSSWIVWCKASSTTLPSTGVPVPGWLTTTPNTVLSPESITELPSTRTSFWLNWTLKGKKS